jgi:hypothetical protein
MREGLFTGLRIRRCGSVLSRPIFSGPVACADLVNFLQPTENAVFFHIRK